MELNDYKQIVVNGELITRETLSSMCAEEFAGNSAIMRDLYSFLQEWFNDEIFVMVQTSGSTGEPKQMKASKQQMINSAKITCCFLNLKKGDTALHCMPLRYIAGKMMVVRAIVAGLNLIVVEPCGHPLKDWKGKLDFAAMIPLQVANSLSVRCEKDALEAIENLIIGGGSIDAGLEEELITLHGNIYSTYGMTETLSHVALRRINGIEHSDYYTPLSSVSMSLSNEGTLIIDAPQVCDKLLVTNDIAVMLPNGKFKIVGRKDNIINSGGVKIQTERVEEKLKGKIDVPYAVTSVLHKLLGEAVVLVLEYENGNSSTAREDEIFEKGIIGVCNKVLERFERPKRIIYVNKLPLTETGKINRAALKLMAVKIVGEALV